MHRKLNHINEAASITVLVLFVITLIIFTYYFYWHNLTYTTVAPEEENVDV